MTFHLYVRPDGTADVVDYEIDLSLFPGYQYLGPSENKPDVSGRKYVDGQWVWGDGEPEYLKLRRYSYPSYEALLLALWRAMDTGVLPKVSGFYDEIKEVNARFPPR